jgi:hypothetical protein
MRFADDQEITAREHAEARNIFPMWNASPFVARDVYEHGCFADSRTDLGGHSGAFFDRLAHGTRA